MKISVICVYNKREDFENQLLSSLKEQNINYELIALDNTCGQFKSASSALNYGAERAQGDILIFSHQDICLKRKNELELFAEAISKMPHGDIFGTQGVKEPSKKYYSNLTAGDGYNDVIVNEYEEKNYEVSCVDEGFFGMKKSTWSTLKFNESLCDNWHLYCVEMCLHARKNGGHIYVWPSQLHHFSMGKISLGYMDNLKRLCKVYHNDFKYIWTTCYKVRTNWFYINTLFIVWRLNRKIREKIQWLFSYKV